jgi:hypothetical protein
LIICGFRFLVSFLTKYPFSYKALCAIELLRVNLIKFSSMAFYIYMYRGTVYPRITLVIPVKELIVLLIQADEIYNTYYTVTIRLWVGARLWFKNHTLSRSYFPLMREKWSLSMQNSMERTYNFSHNIFKILMMWQHMNFLLATNLSSDLFYKGQTSTYYERIIYSTSLSYPLVMLDRVLFCPS